MDDCPFCAILSGRAAASIVAEDSTVVAFMDLRQRVPGHVLVVPRRHVPTIYALEPAEGEAVMRMAMRLARAARDAFHPAGLNLWQSNGEVAGQEVWHFHMHVAPRAPNDGLLSLYRDDLPQPSSRDFLDTLAVELKNHLAQV